jgi:K+/H+ antiporter YhaU regulatory subunit KhtT
MLAVIVSTTISRLVRSSSVHVQHLEEQGYQMSEGRESNILKSIFISDVELNPLNSVHENTKLPELVEKIIKNPSNSFYTVNDKDQITGVITEVELRPILTEYENVRDFLVANDIANPNVTLAKPDDDLDYVLRLFSKLNVDSIPIISGDDKQKILGAISRQEILLIYNHESLKLNLAEGLSNELKTITDSGSSTVAAGYSLAEVNVPIEIIGKSLTELKIRSNYGLEVLMIKQPHEMFDESLDKDLIISADPNYKFKWGDKLVVFGEDKNIERFKKI